jgi:hypothetical protein
MSRTEAFFVLDMVSCTRSCFRKLFMRAYGGRGFLFVAYDGLLYCRRATSSSNAKMMIGIIASAK